MTISQEIGESLWLTFHHLPGCSVKVEFRPPARVYYCSLWFSKPGEPSIRFEMSFTEDAFAFRVAKLGVLHVCSVFEGMVGKTAPGTYLDLQAKGWGPMPA